MKKNKILEYYEGTPDNVHDYDTDKIYRWQDGDTIAFGYFPTNIDGSYEFLSGETSNHMKLAENACGKLFGKALHHISSEYFNFVMNQCYDKCYGIGRLWKNKKIIAFWYEPTKELLSDIILKLNIDPHEYIYVSDNNEYGEDETVYEHLKNCNGGDDGSDSKNIPFRISPKIKDEIERYNETEKSWQVQKERSGWDTIAQRNAMIYQEGKERINEYFRGDPDTIDEYDDDTHQRLRSYHYDEANVISFGFFQTSLDGKKEFIFRKNASHHEISLEFANKIIGKAIASDNIDDYAISYLAREIYDSAAFAGRIFLDANIITTWHRFSSSTLERIIDLLGGLEKWHDLNYIIPEVYDSNWDSDALSQVQISVVDYINKGVDGKEERDNKLLNTNIKDSLYKWLVDEIIKYNTPNSTLAAKTAKLGNMTIAQYNSLIHQEGKEGKETINEYFGGNPDTLTRYDYSKRDSGLLGKIGGFINKLTNKKGFTPQHIRQEYYYDEGNTITFGYFQDSIDGQKIFKKTENGTHLDIARACTESYVRNAKSRIGRNGYDKVREAIINTSACKGRVFLKPKVLTTWCVVTSAKLKEIVGLLGIENPQEYYYVVNKNEYNLLEYINSNHSESSGDGDESRFDAKIEDINDRKLQKYLLIIKDYNSPSSKLVDKSRKLGKMTIAQYNSLIHQENKKSKQTIKENMENKGYKKEFSNYISIMKEALSRENFDAYVAAKEMLEEAIEERKHEKELAEELNTNNFGILNHIFEERLPELFKKNKRAVRDVIKTIKEDKNLLGQFKYYNAIKNYRGKIAESLGVDTVSDKLNEAASKTIDKNTVIKSNSKLRRIMKEHNIIPLDFISDEEKKLYESGHNILTKKDGIGNVMTIAESVKNIRGYMDKHKNDFVKESVDPDKLIKEFKENLKDSLTESEMSFVQQITDWRSPIAEQRKEKLFNKFKNECIDKINEMLKEDADNAELKGLNDKINEMKFNKETIVTDIAKLLEIRDILLDE